MIHTQAYNIDCITTGEHFKHGGRCCLSNMPPAGHTVLASAPALFGACDYGRLLVHLHLNLSHVCHSTMYVRSLNMAQPSVCRVAPACMCEGIQLCLQLTIVHSAHQPETWQTCERAGFLECSGTQSDHNTHLERAPALLMGVVHAIQFELKACCAWLQFSGLKSFKSTFLYTRAQRVLKKSSTSSGWTIRRTPRSPRLASLQLGVLPSTSPIGVKLIASQITESYALGCAAQPVRLQ